ncbi:helix-turn-helix domain-containing protein [Kribbella qitaiheensis]|uniref:arsenate reductase/protein-tyrosine-phosphatase family protein n=1 Tax=Kribbella qitaiheensis TaxID=1544730 RepID=UPI00361AD3E6
MNIERVPLAERARIHAALGDPARLAIVDTLVAGDAAPGELGVVLDMPTNLIAHHLKVLEDAGLVVRSRSEGDRRRTYVRLVAEVLESVVTPSLTVVPRVVFVCTQNSARSQLAASIWSRRSHIPALSAGTQPAAKPHPRAVRVARKRGLDPAAWRTAHVGDVVERDDLVIAVCDIAYEHLPAGARPRLHWSVPDPAAVDTDAAFEAAYDEIADRIDRLAPVLSPTKTTETPRSRP